MLASCATAFAADPDAPPRFAADARDFGIRLILVDDKDAFLRMWAKPATPNIRLMSSAAVATPVSVVVLFSGGHPGADGNCDLVYTMSVRDEREATASVSGEQQLCGGHPPRSRQETVLGDTIAGFVTGTEPAKLVVSVTVVDRTTGIVLTASAPLEVVKTPFRFESVRSLDDMAALIRTRFKIGSSRDDLRRVFVEQGRSTLKTRPARPDTEKYLYDINLCSYYVWRWNVSADFDEVGKLRQAYVNGEPVFADGTPKQIAPKAAADGKKATIRRGQRSRPEAYKGEKSLAFVTLERDTDPKTTTDQFLTGAGPSRPDPIDMGAMHVYSDVDPWRSIFDSDVADRIDDYAGNCAAVDAKFDGTNRKPTP